MLPAGESFYNAKSKAVSELEKAAEAVKKVRGYYYSSANHLERF